MSSDPVARTSTRNKLASTITAIKRGDILSQVEMQSGDNHLVAVITTEAVDEMGLHEGMEVVAMFKSTSVMIATTHTNDHNAG
ncbi:MAG: TOBE domain-containing protein [Chloroflexia bacterium]